MSRRLRKLNSSSKEHSEPHMEKKNCPVAEVECKNVSSTQPDTSLEAHEFMLTHLEKLVHKAKEAHQNWSCWTPPAEKEDFNCHVRELKAHLPKLVSRKAAFIKAVSFKIDP